MLDLFISTLTQGLIYSLLSYGIFITYKILDFPDLTVDGSFPLGAAVTAVLLVRGVNPYLTLMKGLKHLTPFIKLQEWSCKTVPSAAIPFYQVVCE